MRANSEEEEDFSQYAFDEDAPHLDDAPDEVTPFEADNDVDNDSFDSFSAIDEDDVEAKTEDAVAEADIYLSLGQDDKAEGLLQKEIQQNPDNADARLALLKMYAKAQNPSSFDDQYAQLLPLGNVNANNQAQELRETIAGITNFDTDSYSLDDATMDLDSSNELLPDSDELLSEEPSIEAGELDLDLDLDFDNDVDFLSDEPNTALETNDFDLGEDSSSSVDSDNSSDELEIDLDLDLDDVDISNDLSGDATDEGFNVDLGDDESLANDLLTLDEQDSNDANLALDLEDDFIADLDLDGTDDLDITDSLSADVEDTLEGSEASLDDLDIDLPADDLDIESLDKEIDEMTATLDVPEDNLAASVFGDNAADSAMDAELNALDADIAGIDNILDSDLDNVAEVTDYGLDDLLDDSDMADDLTSLDVAENNIGNADLDLDGDADAIAGFDSTTLDDELAALDAVPAEGAEVTTIEDLQESFVEESAVSYTHLTLPTTPYV